ncbi:AAA family ATPase [Baekduia soli]|uniref:DNA 3'-5' helicase n=1 Tax=Baekduia soli TaxID=496014 RepID=A0A5B8UAK8_9ACTN|nr:UvrD-helicase domain-containing protein [Baekduia soli]QEC50014.1 AAA family ATPase [Baekduia soli]
MHDGMTAAGRLYDDGGAMVGRDGLPFTAQQATAIARREGALLLSANAGSGKTSVLSERFVRSVLEDDLEPGRILAITFTDKAAGELRARVRARFVELGRRDRARDLEAAWISTFHGLCARILRSHAVRAGLDPAFGVLEDAEARDVRSEAFEAALAAFLAGEREEALDLAAAYGVDALQATIVRTHDQLRSSGMTRPALPPVRAEAPDPAPLAAALRAAQADLAGLEGKTIAGAGAALAACTQLLERNAPTLAGLEAAAFRPGNTKALKSDACAAYLAALEVFAGATRDALAARAVALLNELLGRHADAYAAAKRARGALDFDDLELLARDLLADAPAVRAAYADRFERVMVDEFQDTNAVQLHLLELLGGERFVVGDELQSIYGFRHADVRIFRAQRAALQQTGDAAALAANFRSRPEILSVIDDATGDLHGPAHVPFVAGREAADTASGARVELLLTDADAVAAWPPETLASLPLSPERRRAEARVVAARVAALVGEEGVDPADVVVLLRAATDMAVFERALEEEGLTTLAAGGRGYWGRQQVLDLCAYLGALANPRDELALFGLLASPLVGLGADGLAILARGTARGARWEALASAFVAGERSPVAADLPDADRDALANFCPWFAAERERAPRLGLDELLERAVDRTGYDLHVLGLPGGRRRWANVLKLQRLAAGFEGRRGRDLRGLIDLATAELEAQARETDAPVEAAPSNPGGAVRLMTMHAAKGLEFAVVVIADLGRAGRSDADDLLVQGGRVGLRLRTVDGGSAKALDWEALRDEQAAAGADEERRILHVAMTRAQERLLLSGTFEADRWLGAPRPAVAPLRWLAPRVVAGLQRALPEAPDGESWPGDPDPAAPAPRVTVTVHRTPPAMPRALPSPVAAEAPGPGLPEPPAAAPGGQLTLDLFAEPAAAAAPPPAGAGAGGPPVRPATSGTPPRPLPAALSYSSLSAYDRCGYRWYLERVLRLPREEADAATAAAACGEDPAAVGGPAGLDPLVRGSLAHLLLEGLDLAAPAPPGAEAVRELAELHEAEVTDADVADLQALVAAFVDGPLAGRLAAAPDVRREHGFVVGLGDDAAPLLHGVIDVLAFEAQGGALVVDYKTDVVAGDADLEAHVEADYGIQRHIYALAALGAGAPDVEVAHLYLARPHAPVVAVYDRADVPRLRADIQARIADLAAGRFVPTDEPHRALCLTCPGRRALCHHPEELTLRDAPRPSAPTG